MDDNLKDEIKELLEGYEKKESKGGIFKGWIVKILIALISANILSDVYLFYNSNMSREDDYISKYISCERSLNQLDKKVQEVTFRLSIIELSTDDLPFPYWIKNLEGDILFVNKAYVKLILEPMGITKMDIIGTKGEVIGGKSFVDEILKNDQIVIDKAELLVFKENVPGYGLGDSYKYPTRDPFGNINGTAGIWIKHVK